MQAAPRGLPCDLLVDPAVWMQREHVLQRVRRRRRRDRRHPLPLERRRLGRLGRRRRRRRRRNGGHGWFRRESRLRGSGRGRRLGGRPDDLRRQERLDVRGQRVLRLRAQQLRHRRSERHMRTEAGRVSTGLCKGGSVRLRRPVVLQRVLRPCQRRRRHGAPVRGRRRWGRPGRRLQDRRPVWRRLALLLPVRRPGLLQPVHAARPRRRLSTASMRSDCWPWSTV
jgi:hypothetical protein